MPGKLGSRSRCGGECHFMSRATSRHEIGNACQMLVARHRPRWQHDSSINHGANAGTGGCLSDYFPSVRYVAFSAPASLLQLVCSSLSICLPSLLCLAIWLLFLCVSLRLLHLTPPPPFLSISIPIMHRVSCLLLCLCLTMHLSRIKFARIGTGWLFCFYYFVLLKKHDFRGPDII